MIYLVKVGDYYKIGYSNSLKRRLIDLQVSNAQEVELVDSWEGGQMDEKVLHDRFAPRLVRGEWFDLRDEDLQLLKNEKARQERDKPPKKINRSFRMKIKFGGCVLCASQRYYEGKENTLTCEICGQDYDVTNLKKNHGREQIEKLIRWYDYG